MIYCSYTILIKRFRFIKLTPPCGVVIYDPLRNLVRNMNTNFIHPDSKFNRVLTAFCDLFFLGLLWLLTAWPIVTLPTAGIALYDSVAHCVMGEEEGPFRRYFRTFWRELGRGLLIGIVWVVFAIILWMGNSYLSSVAGTSSIATWYLYIYRFSILIPLAVLCWLIPVESRFVYRFGQLHKTAAAYTFGYLPRTAGMLAVLALVIVGCFIAPILILFAPGAVAVLHCLLIEKVLKANAPKEDMTNDTTV